MDDSAREFAAALGEVLAQFGRRVIDRPDVLRGALADTLGSSAVEHREELDAVVAASRVGVAGQIRDAGTRAATPEEVQAWFDQLVAAGVALRDAALATRSWAEVLDASDTARVTSELSEGILGDDDLGRSVVGRITSTPSAVEDRPMTRLTPDEGATEMSELSAFGDDDRTVMPPVPERPPAPVAVPPVAGETAASGPEPQGDELDTPPRHRRGWMAYLPTVVAGLVTVLALALGIPIIAANATPVTMPPFKPVELGDDPLFAKNDLHQFALTEDALAALVPAAGTIVAAKHHGEDPYFLGFDAVDPACAAAFAAGPAAEEASLGLYISAAYDVPNWLWVDSVSRWYETDVQAEQAILKLTTRPEVLTSPPTPSPCTAPASLNDGNTFSSTFAPAASAWLEGVRIERSALTVATTPAWVHQRHCYRNRNIVTCVNVSGTGTAGLGSITPGVALPDALDSLFTKILPYRESGD